MCVLLSLCSPRSAFGAPGAGKETAAKGLERRARSLDLLKVRLHRPSPCGDTAGGAEGGVVGRVNFAVPLWTFVRMNDCRGAAVVHPYERPQRHRNVRPAYPCLLCLHRDWACGDSPCKDLVSSRDCVISIWEGDVVTLNSRYMNYCNSRITCTLYFQFSFCIRLCHYVIRKIQTNC